MNSSILNNSMSGSISGLIATVGSSVIKESIKEVKNKSLTTIELSEWDSAYWNVSKIIYSLDKRAFTKHRIPTVNKNHYELSINTKYTIKLKDGNTIKVHCFRDELKVGYQEYRLKLTFYGKDKYIYRRKVLTSALKLTDKKHIKVLYLGKDKTIYQDILPHNFDRIILNEKVKSNIIDGLNNWKNS